MLGISAAEGILIRVAGHWHVERNIIMPLASFRRPHAPLSQPADRAVNAGSVLEAELGAFAVIGVSPVAAASWVGKPDAG